MFLEAGFIFTLSSLIVQHILSLVFFLYFFCIWFSKLSVEPPSAMRHRCMEDNHSSFPVTCPGKAEINHKLPSICGARWLGTILVSKYMMGKWEGERERGRKVRVLRRVEDLKRQGQWRNGWHGWLFATDSHGDIWPWAAPKGRVLIHGPVTILMVCIVCVAPITTEGPAATWSWATTFYRVGVQGMCPHGGVADASGLKPDLWLITMNAYR